MNRTPENVHPWVAQISGKSPTDEGTSSSPQRLLVVIASFGTGHLGYLKKIIRTYQELPMEVKVVVCSEAPKDLGADVEVVVGLPSRNPWSLPFAHKAIFAREADRHDLFVYSEDDIGVSENNIRAFLQATSKLPPDEIAGFLRYEVAESGERYLAEPWGHFHWKPESVRMRGDYAVAEFTNEHAGFYILTQWQLKQAIASGGFLRRPYKGRYSWPETAATDPYTSCGFKKVICITALEDFLVHHLPNRYVKSLPVSLDTFKNQIKALLDILAGLHPATTLCAVEPPHWHNSWQKSFFEAPEEELLRLIPENTQSLLSVGCGWGATERLLNKRGIKITALPLDSVMGATTASDEIDMVYGSLDECFGQLKGRKFDCVILTNLLHLQPKPNELVAKCAAMVREGGGMVFGGPNFDRFPWITKRILNINSFGKLRSFARSGISICGPSSLTPILARSGYKLTATRWINHEVHQRRFAAAGHFSLGRLTARDWLLQAAQIKDTLS
jgi:SAM-dependent methyltransferase